LQNIVQNPHFFEICTTSTARDISHSRENIIEMLHILFYLYPNNTCQPSHVEPLAHIYGGTLSKTDRQLLSIFQLFENQRKSSVASIIVRWHSPSNLTSPTPLEALQALDPTRLLRTCLVYPTRRCFTEEFDENESPYDGQIYDPVFVLLLFALMLLESPPASALAWVQLYRTNVVGLLIRSLSANNNGIRRAALCQIAGLWRCLEVRISVPAIL
jgi:nucleolar pre-ribosomal-associated protein 1